MLRFSNRESTSAIREYLNGISVAAVSKFPIDGYPFIICSNASIYSDATLKISVIGDQILGKNGVPLHRTSTFFA